MQDNIFQHTSLDLLNYQIFVKPTDELYGKILAQSMQGADWSFFM